VTERTGLRCETCGPADIPEGQDPYQAAIAHAELTKHTVHIYSTETITPEEQA